MVERALASDRPPKYERSVVPTAFTPFEPVVRRAIRDQRGHADDRYVKFSPCSSVGHAVMDRQNGSA